MVLKAGQTPQDSPDTADFSISSMGFDGQGRFHIRLTMAEGFTGDGLLAVPYDAGNEQMGSTLERIAVDGGMDCVVGGSPRRTRRTWRISGYMGRTAAPRPPSRARGASR